MYCKSVGILAGRGAPFVQSPLACACGGYFWPCALAVVPCLVAMLAGSSSHTPCAFASRAPSVRRSSLRCRFVGRREGPIATNAKPGAPAMQIGRRCASCLLGFIFWSWWVVPDSSVHHLGGAPSGSVLSHVECGKIFGCFIRVCFPLNALALVVFCAIHGAVSRHVRYPCVGQQ